jgi:hypothetical protein
MLKRILFTLMTLLAVYSGAVVIYIFNEPDHVDTAVFAAMGGQQLDYESLREYTLNSGSSATHYYFFCSQDSDDCTYVENTVMRETAAQTKLDLSALIEYVDVTELEANMETSRLKTEWNISTYPAFAAVQNKNGTIEILNILEWDASAPLSSSDLTLWLQENGLIPAATN